MKIKMKKSLIINLIVLAMFVSVLSISQQLIYNSPSTPGIDDVLAIDNSTTKSMIVGDLTVNGSCTGCGGSASIPALTQVLKEGNTATESIILSSGSLTTSTILGTATNSIVFGSNAYGTGWDSNSNTFRLYNSTYPTAYLFSANLPFGAMGGLLVTDGIGVNDPSLMLYSIPSQHTAIIQLGSPDTSATGSIQIIGKNGSNYRRATINPSTSMAGDITLTLPTVTGTFALTSTTSGCFDAGDSGEHITITNGSITDISAGNCP